MISPNTKNAAGPSALLKSMQQQ